MKREETAGVRIGLEIHCQLTALKTKLFCPCSSDYRGRQPNELVCPVCFGLPGTLPVLNGKGVEYAIRIANALGCKVAGETNFYRKNYFYPDLSKNFQISQYDKAGGVPIASGGHVQLGGKRVRIRRIQLEEDPGKLTYEGTIEKSSYSLVDYNRAGIALVEIVTEPDFETAKEAKVFLERLRSTIEALGVSDGELEGAMRCDANISVAGGEARVEVKNISSFREVEKALNYEILRQGTFSGTGGLAVSETRHWDERRSITISLRLKEGEQDYRYFPEPDIPAVILSQGYLEQVRSATPEVPEARAERYVRELNLAPQTAEELSRDEGLSLFFEETVRSFKKGPEIANWLLGEVPEQTRPKLTGEERSVTPQGLSELLAMLDSGRVTRPQAKEIFKQMTATGNRPSELKGSETEGVVADEGAIEKVVSRLIGEGEVAREAKRNPKAFNYLVGQVLRLEPRADPKVVAKTIARMIGEQ
ncbi:MAG: Asp-tRNA(Asn)/Glu-tRNA(Gln) amidotransferase subunit GatB [Thaumarchaeota archaeon]|nr:Asp-tRNA(Asn)/Glu-tRNA(Gln) amidotransferase subunit GatB [Nitrososphaerota archaeon]